MREREKITAALRELLSEQLERDVLPVWSSHIQRDLELDSMKQLALIVKIENHFEIAFDPEDDAVETVGELIMTIERHLNEKQG